MPLLIRNLRLNLSDNEEELLVAVAKRLRVSTSAIRTYSVVRRSLDARKKDVHFRYHVEVALDESPEKERARLEKLRREEATWIVPTKNVEPDTGDEPLSQRPVVVGFGPAGMFAALRLAQWGFRPIVLERGRPVRQRHRDIMQGFYRDGRFDPTSNLLFGEGGAGTYSDGKLYTRVNDPLCRLVLETLYHHGADPDILINTRPHIGSDRLPTICTRIRQTIESLGGELRFECQLHDVKIDEGTLTKLHIRNGSQPADSCIAAGPTVLAVGHSARDTIRMLAERGVTHQTKPFQIGVRIEHPQDLVNRWQYGDACGHTRLGPAEYQLVAKGAAGDAGDMFSFCMCPGGTILPTNEIAGLIATNGASRANRSGEFANSGLVMTMHPDKLGLNAIEAMAFQEKWERLAFAATDDSYRVPAQRAQDFLHNNSSEGALETSYPLGGQWVELRHILPPAVSAGLERALPLLDRKLPGFAGPHALVTGPETRASGPIRLTRDPETRESIGTMNLYPVGEGAGYAGGIVTSAVDGIKTADAIIKRYAPPK